MTVNLSDTPSLIKTFTAPVNSSGIASVQITQSNHGLAWQVFQIGFALGQVATSPEIAAHFNGVPLVSSAAMQASVFANIPGAAPYAMEMFFYGPPYLVLESGDAITCAVMGANQGDTFTVAAYVQEIASPAMAAANNARAANAQAYIPRAGTRRWS